jgi:chromate transporter
MSSSASGERVPSATLLEIFIAFLLIGASSFGGGVVAYLRSMLVVRKRWLDDEQFISALGIAQTLPGLNATNMSVIVGDRLRGPGGATVAFLGMTLPGAIAVLALGIFYAAHSDNPGINAALVGVGAASVGLLGAVTFQIGQRCRLPRDLLIAATTVILISFLHVPLLIVLVTMGPLAVLLHRPSGLVQPETGEESL